MKRILDKAQEHLRFFSNEGKKTRERWVLDHWMELSQIRPSTPPIERDAPDFIVDDLKVEIVEVLPPDRKPHADYEKAFDAIRDGKLPEFRLGPSLPLVIRSAHEWVLTAVRNKSAHYGRSSSTWILVAYANFAFDRRADWKAVTSDLEAKQPFFNQIDVLAADGRAILAQYTRSATS
jgi:hypothetical protein